MADVRLIDANALKERFQTLSNELFEVDDIDRVIDSAPTIDPETLRPVAHWDGQYDGYSDGEPVYDVWVCSNCGHIIDDGTDCEEDLPHYCPVCGAKMEGKK